MDPGTWPLPAAPGGLGCGHRLVRGALALTHRDEAESATAHPPASTTAVGCVRLAPSHTQQVCVTRGMEGRPIYCVR
jgi:hypothetical protein